MALRKKQRLDRKDTSTKIAPETPPLIINQQAAPLAATNTTSQVFVRPFTFAENLEGAVGATKTMNETLKRSLSFLTNITQNLKDQEWASTSVRKFDVATLSDLEHLRQDLARDITPAVEKALDSLERQLFTLTQKEADLATEVETQEKYLGELRAIVKANKQQQQQQRKRNSSRSTPADTARLEQLREKKQKLMDMIKREDDRYAKEEEAIMEIKRASQQLGTQMEAMAEDNMGEERLMRREQELEKELNNLDIKVNSKMEELKRRTEEQAKLTKSNTSDVPVYNISKGSKSQYEGSLELFINVVAQITRPGFTASTNMIHDCDTYGKKYHQAIQTEKLYIQMEDKEKQEQYMNEQMKQLCKSLIPNHIESKTTSRVIELVTTNGGTIPIQQLLDEFPPTIEKRHNLTKVTLLLIQANILKISGTDLIIAASFESIN